MGTVGQDLRYAWRQLRKHPGFAVLAIFTMALGIVANSTIFTWIHSTLFNPVPGVTRTGDMVTLRRGESISPPLSYDDYADLRDRTRTLTGLLAYHDDSMSITGSSTPERIYGALASSNYFQVLGVQPVLGRTFLPAQTNERAGAAEAVIGYDLWQRRFAGDPAILGKTIQINLHPYTIVGVAPRGFVGCKTGLRTELWIPLGMDRQVFGWPRVNDRSVTWLNALGTLAPGVDRRQADKELNLLMQRIAGRYPLSHQGENRLATDPLWRSPFGVNVYLFGTLPILEALAALLLLLACANVANLLLVRSVARRRELAIRLSMGAGHWRVVRQLLTENLVLALAGGAAALALTLWTSRSLGLFVTASPLPIVLDGEVDRAVLLATVAVSIFTAVLSGLLPALRATALAPAEVLKEESLGSTGGIAKSRLSGSLVILQVALSLLLLVCAGLFVRSLRHAQSIDPGFDPNNILLASVDFGPAGYSTLAGIEMERQLLDRVSGLPGVQSATLADFSPLNFTIHSESASSPEGYVPASHESLEVDRGIVGPGYLKTLRTPLIAGRDFTAQDNSGAQPVAIVNQAYVDRYWPGQNAIGKHLQAGRRWRTVVGVAANGKYRNLSKDPAPLFLLPLLQNYSSETILHLRVSGDPLSYVPAVQRIVDGLHAGLPLYNVATLETSMQMGSVFQRIVVAFAGAFGLLALVLAAIGLYGVMAYTTRQRAHEIGIRMALGASRASVFRQVLGQGLRLTLAGLVLGLAVAFSLTRLLRGMLYGVGTADGLTFLAVAALLCVVALIACLVPARRATSIEPIQALRAE